MNMAVVDRKHFSVAINWVEKPIEWHLEQYGSWLLQGDNYTNLGFSSVLGHLIDTANGVVMDKRERVAPRCQISDEHADAVNDMLVEIMQKETAKVKDWLKVVIMFFVEFRSEEKIARILNLSEYKVTRDKMLGLVRLATKYNLKSRITGG